MGGTKKREGDDLRLLNKGCKLAGITKRGEGKRIGEG